MWEEETARCREEKVGDCWRCSVLSSNLIGEDERALGGDRKRHGELEAHPDVVEAAGPGLKR